MCKWAENIISVPPELCSTVGLTRFQALCISIRSLVLLRGVVLWVWRWVGYAGARNHIGQAFYPSNDRKAYDEMSKIL